MQTEFKNRMNDLAERAYRENKFVFSDFLSESEVSDLLSCEREFAYAGIKLFGGAEHCTRKIARFGDLPAGGEFPVQLLKIAPKAVKFAGELTHRDFLGAILSLGLERDVLGDLFVTDKICYCYCLTRVAPYLCEHLKSVGKTAVSCAPSEESAPTAPQRKSESYTLSSLRADCFLSAVYRLSRAEALEYFRGERVFLNGKLCTENAKELKTGDCISARGKGKFYVGETGETTKKGKFRVTIERPV